jgi:hypothetical protein
MRIKKFSREDSEDSFDRNEDEDKNDALNSTGKRKISTAIGV